MKHCPQCSEKEPDKSIKYIKAKGCSYERMYLIYLQKTFNFDKGVGEKSKFQQLRRSPDFHKLSWSCDRHLLKMEK